MLFRVPVCIPADVDRIVRIPDMLPIRPLSDPLAVDVEGHLFTVVPGGNHVPSQLPILRNRYGQSIPIRIDMESQRIRRYLNNPELMSFCDDGIRRVELSWSDGRSDDEPEFRIKPGVIIHFYPVVEAGKPKCFARWPVDVFRPPHDGALDSEGRCIPNKPRLYLGSLVHPIPNKAPLKRGNNVHRFPKFVMVSNAAAHCVSVFTHDNRLW